MWRRTWIVGAASAALVASALVVLPGAAAAAGNTRQISRAGTASLSGTATGTGSVGVQSPEIPPGLGDDGAAGPNRSHSGGGGSPVGAIAQPKNVTLSAPELQTSFDGLDHFDQRFGSDAGNNQFSLEPPDQGLCANGSGSGSRVLEVINDVLAVYDTSGNMIAGPKALNGFLGFAPAIVRSSPPVFGPFVTDPSCLYDAATDRWYLDVLTLDTDPANGKYVGTDHLDLAVSNSNDPAGTWTVYHIAVQDDGTAGTPNHGCSSGGGTPPAWVTNPTACFGDYPHIGADTNGLYLTTNEYSFFGPEFHGAQIYAFSKAQVAAHPATLTMSQFDTHGLDTFGFALNGFTLWPAVSPGGVGDPAAGGTEWFLSSNAGAEAHDTGNGQSTASPSTQLLVWGLTNTSSLTGTPALTLRVAKDDVGQYGPPPPSAQMNGQQPLKDCLNSNPCSITLEGIKDPYPEKTADIDSNDSRMQQTQWVNGKLWGALDTALNVASGKQAGVEWFDVSPTATSTSVSATLANQGYLALGNDNLTYPAIGITAGGTGVMAFTVVGNDFYPSAGYATVTPSGVGTIHVAASGQGPDDGFTNYRLFGVVPGVARPRWGDYGAAVPVGGNVWIASEYIGQSCSFSTYKTSNFQCGGTRTALGNWDTRISLVAAPTP
jgi:hypothetical protein